ncbi:BQ5605_C016g08094 [Microbotryum silenes-dioicae]|uniref:BQ5605_C016g08094 protein n=1 Tax=Microbotryum silenes-dioicae TaxID=796604 RepID=A0A2X0LZ82_9BASI|nr:BQ5605_C016g08094 [Microbotryum silenes-dioicae]
MQDAHAAQTAQTWEKKINSASLHQPWHDIESLVYVILFVGSRHFLCSARLRARPFTGSTRDTTIPTKQPRE